MSDRNYARLKVIELIEEGDACAEIGVWKGDFSEQIISREPRELHLIDPWRFQSKFPGRLYGGVAAKSQQDMDAICESVARRFTGNPTVKIQRSESIAAAAAFADQYFDWVYVDGDHSFDAALADLVVWYPKVKSAGFLCVDDLNWRDEMNRLAVGQACEKFIADRGIKTARVVGDQFIIRKD
jgi:methyltransferase family protein